MVTGAAPYAQVQEYAAIGHHRTGTENDKATRHWLADHLRKLTDDITEVPYEFPRYVVHEHTVTINGEHVESIPLWYSGDGRYDTATLTREPHDATVGHTDHATERTSSGASGPRILATQNNRGLLAAINRAPSTAGSDMVALVAGAWAPHLDDADIHLSTSVEHTVGRSASVIARLGAWTNPGEPAPIVVTTPLSGWFTCAGERGTGIAVALALASELAEDQPVLFAGTTGHEIGYLAIEELVATSGLGTPGAIIHLGASVAAGTVEAGVGTLSPERLMISSRNPSEIPAITDIATDAGLSFVHDPPNWFGEGEVLKRVGAPLLSFLGGFPYFHTPADTVENATTPTMLSDADTAVRRAAAAFISA